MKERIIFVFPGQGAQHPGMAKDIYEEYPVVRETFEQVSDISHIDMAKLCFEAGVEDLKKPVNTSLSILTHSVSVGRIIEKEFGNPLHNISYALSGYSLGQYSALYFADSISLKDIVSGLSADAFYSSNTKVNGGMACAVGLFKNQVEEIIEQVKPFGFIAVSNHNLKNQFVVSGEMPALEKFVELAKQAGARIAKVLDASIPVHCELMRGSADKLSKVLKNVKVKSPKTNWFSSTTGNVMGSVDDVRGTLVNQMTKGVRWLDVMEKFPEYQIKQAYELGPGTSLTSLIKRADVGCKASSTDNSKYVKKMLLELEGYFAKQR